MAIKNEKLKEIRQRKYLAKDFDGFRSQLLEYANLYYPNRIKDFSDASVGGLFLDFCAYVGDSLSFYLDHQYAEMDPETAIEQDNIERILLREGVPITGASPATVYITAYVQIPAALVNNRNAPFEDALPIIKQGSTFISDKGIQFTLLEDIDFTETDPDTGKLKAEQKVGQSAPNGTVTTYILAQEGLCVSGTETSETVSIGAAFVPFKKITLSNPNVTDIISVNDSLGNEYYKVGALTHDVVYTNVTNYAYDSDEVPEVIKVIPAPYRFITNTNIRTRRSVLTFGGGNANTLEDDVIPDPSEFAINFPYRQTFSRVPVNPESLLQTKTLGVASTNCQLNIMYRYGGGLNHNVTPNTLRTIQSLIMEFPGNPTPSVAAQIRGNTEITNNEKASGGEDAPTLNDLKDLIPGVKNSQERVVSRQDLLARTYTMPSNFGRVYRAQVRSNPNNPLATQMFIISRNANGKLIQSTDTLKQNLAKYLNPYRMISDAIDVLDAKIINIEITFELMIESALNRATVIQACITRLKSFFDTKNFHIDQPIVIEEVRNVITAVRGVISINELDIDNITGTVANREYSNNTYDLENHMIKQVIIPPPGGIFEVKYPDVNIIGRAI